jgi:hypothetical protein
MQPFLPITLALVALAPSALYGVNITMNTPVGSGNVWGNPTNWDLGGSAAKRRPDQ